MAVWLGYAFAWQGLGGTEAGIKQVMKRVAYACRYGNASMVDALTIDQMVLQDFIDAVSDIVREENSSSRK